jgi:hypothetical protein
MMTSWQEAEARRRVRWGQTPATRIAGPADAAQLIERLGIVTLYPASSEMPNLFQAYLGDPAARTDSGHDSPSGEVYSWRWTLGKQEAAYYSVLVRRRPTWVSWALMPAVLRLCGETRMPDELYDLGVLSADAYRIAQALDVAGGVLSTGELRTRAGFPTGKSHRAAYLKAMDELERRLLLAKVFTPAPDDLEMRHALVSVRYPNYVAAAGRLSRDEAWRTVLEAYLPAAVYAVPAVLAEDVKLPETEVQAALDRLAASGQATTLVIPTPTGPGYLWTED